jgi:hypothetical protein
MLATQIACAAIVLLYAVGRLRAPGANRAQVAARLLLLACAGWVGEDTVIRAYGFYGYASGWWLFLDRVPLLVAVIWPIVIDSAYVLARHLVSGAGRVAVAGGLIVLADASLIEPIAVHAHLWSWSPENARSVFDVPPIGILGWGFFACAAIASFELLESRTRPLWNDAVVVAAAPLVTHAALVASWWCTFRWVGRAGTPASPWILAALAWCAALPVTVAAWKTRSTVPLRVVLSRAPGAAFFFALLAATSGGRTDLVLYALAFAPPYLALLTPG